MTLQDYITLTQNSIASNTNLRDQATSIGDANAVANYQSQIDQAQLTLVQLQQAAGQ